MDKFDIVVAGGGMVGALMANLLVKAKLSVLVVEPFDASNLTFHKHPGLRTSAFNRFSIDLLKSVGAWQHVKDDRKAAYTGLQTWENESNPLTFDAADVGAQYLGYILENNQVQQSLWQAFAGKSIEVCSPATIKSIAQGANDITVQLDNGDEVSAKLLIGADGANSKVRKMANIGTEGWQYQQHCMAITVEMAQTHPPVTWQEFHPSGPRAYLPLFENYASLIWYDHADRIAELKQLSIAKLSQQIKVAFPNRLGEFTVLDKGAFALTRMHAKRYYADRIALIGDAAHTINPLAGQGVNLGFKDADKLAQCIITAMEQGKDLSSSRGSCVSSEILNQYHQARYKPNLL
ncbi:MAG: FAD-dependent monooxygenase, partial [Psychrosphaera sp.]|nr:FAD-dependent monooxygenase [Psychrosphaera sp.]